MNKKLCALALSAVMAGGTMCAFTGCSNSDGGTAEKQAYISLDINPSIELIVDKDSNVVSVRGANEDGQILLYEETGIQGEKLDAAIQKITDLAVQYGYLDEENKVVDTLVTSGDSTFASDILAKVNTTITATAANLGLEVTTDGEGVYSLLRQMEEIKNQYPDNAAIQSMSVQKFKLALSVSETGEISIEAAAKLDDSELIDKLKEATDKIEEYATEAYKEAKEKVKAEYEKAKELAESAVYSEFYHEKMLSHISTAYYGSVYQMYATAAKSLNAICDVAEHAASLKNYPLTEEQVSVVVTALGLESADALKDSNGDVTVKSIEKYADKLFKNSRGYEELEQTKEALNQALDQIESAIKEKINQIAEEYQPQIEQATASVRGILTGLEGMVNAMPESVKTALQTAVTDMKDILADMETEIAEGTFGLEDLRGIAKRLEDKAHEYHELILSDLTEEELAELEARKEQVIGQLTENQEALERELEQASKAAKDQLAQLKADLKNKDKK